MTTKEEDTFGPGTSSGPTGGGDFDEFCNGCGESVANPHTWRECTASLRAERDRMADVAIGFEQKAETFEDVLVVLLRDEDPTLTGDVLREKPARDLADLVYATVTRERHDAAVMRGGLDKANAARLAAEHDRDEARAAEEHMRQERDEARKRAREWEDLHEKEMAGRLQEGRYVALQARVEHAEAELLKQMRERKAAEWWRDQARAEREASEGAWHEATGCAGPEDACAEMTRLRARIAELEARLASPTQEQRDNEADMLAWQVGG